MTASKDTIVQHVRKLVFDEPWEDYLTAAISDGSSTSVTVNNPAAWSEGDIMEPRDTTGEELKVRVGGSNPITVKRSHNDTTGASHSNGATLLKNPRFPYSEITEMIDRIGDELWPRVYNVNTTTLTIQTNGNYTYDLTGVSPTPEFLIRVVQDITLSGTDKKPF